MWVGAPLVIGSIAALVVVALARSHRRPAVAGACIAFASIVLAPAAWAVSEAANATLNATLPQAGPRQGAAGGTFGSDAGSDHELAAFLTAERDGERWD